MSDVLEGVRYHESIIDTVGHTPLVRLRRVAGDCKCPVLGKMELFNPGGSVKDRIALAMVVAAEKEGRLKPGGTIVECTSGNTGLGLAMVAAVRGYKSVFTMPDKVSSEKVNLLKAFGAEVLLSPTAVEPDHPDSYYSVAKRITEARPGAVHMNQYHNPANPQAHYESTGPELWEQTGGKITHFVAGMGTGGTISGTAKYLKEKNPDVRIVGADPIGSILKHYHDTGEMGEAHTYKIEGVGEDFIPGALDMSLVDEVISCSDRDGFNFTRRLAREDAIFVGGSAGMAAWVAVEVAKRARPDDLVVALLPDTGERYLSKAHNDDWMRDNHLLDMSISRVSDVVAGRRRDMPPLLAVEVGDRMKKALLMVQEHGITQIPVFRGKDVVGTLYEGEILKKVLTDPAAADQPVESLMAEPLPVVQQDRPMDEVTRLLAARNPAVLVQANGSIVGIVTRYDMLQFIAEEE